MGGKYFLVTHCGLIYNYIHQDQFDAQNEKKEFRTTICIQGWRESQARKPEDGDDMFPRNVS
jgi:hypothetical protein